MEGRIRLADLASASARCGRMTRSLAPSLVGWAAVVMSTMAASFWAFWGIVENFHEGWYHHSLVLRLGMMLGQYLLPMLLILGAAIVALSYQRLGVFLHIAAAAWTAWHFRGAAVLVVYVSIVLPLLLMAAGYGLGRPEPRKTARLVVIGVPLVVLIAAGVSPALGVVGRHVNTNLGPERITQNGIDLVWAPAGPGWPDEGVSWEEAVRIARHLTPDGLTVTRAVQDVWRLPTVDEVVRSQQRRGRNSRGTWDPSAQRASYVLRPDKEAPLWRVHSKIIYMWTATSPGEGHAFVAVYSGQVIPRPKAARWGYLGFRAVREPSPTDRPDPRGHG